MPSIPELTDQNHFQFGYDNKAFSFRSHPDQQWFVQYGVCKKNPLNFKAECLRTAQLIRDKTKEPIYVMFSGGVDSEVVLRSFVESKIAITAAIMRYKNEINNHDVEWAVLACKKLKVPYQFYDLDLLEFWKNDSFAYAERTYCVSPQLLSTMWLVDQIDGYPIMGSAECLFVKDVPQDYKPGISPYERSDWYLWEKEKIASWYRHFIVKNKEGCPGFYQYTPEIMLSYIQDPFVQDLLNDRIIGKLSTESSKLKIYQQHFDVESRPKYTGFEKVQEQDAYYRKNLRAQFRGCDQVFKTKVSELISRLNGSRLLQSNVHNRAATF